VRKAAFLDRDGVINQKAPEGRYITTWDEMHFLPGVASAIGLLNRSGFRVIVVSNQRCVAKGLISVTEIESLHQRMCETLAAAGATIDGVYYCPHEKNPPCGCRKPEPGMLMTAAREQNVDLATSWMIGDSDADVKAGRAAGCRTARISSNQASGSDIVAPSLIDVIHRILEPPIALATSSNVSAENRRRHEVL
jgi:D-glycero-D-manno-heptose 1,7-bisphosphate phosphatase